MRSRALRLAVQLGGVCLAVAACSSGSAEVTTIVQLHQPPLSGPPLVGGDAIWREAAAVTLREVDPTEIERLTIERPQVSETKVVADLVASPTVVEAMWQVNLLAIAARERVRVGGGRGWEALTVEIEYDDGVRSSQLIQALPLVAASGGDVDLGEIRATVAAAARGTSADVVRVDVYVVASRPAPLIRVETRNAARFLDKDEMEFGMALGGALTRWIGYLVQIYDQDGLVEEFGVTGSRACCGQRLLREEFAGCGSRSLPPLDKPVPPCPS